MRIFFLVLIGLCGGVLGGMGMGGGTVLIPLLTLFLKVNQHLAQWVNLVTFIPMSVVALIIHIKNKLVNKSYILIMLIPSVLTAVGASFLAMKVQSVVLGRFFGGFLILLGAVSIFLTFFKDKLIKKKGGEDKAEGKKENA
jgi:uncharacterized membrane protein YfcA